MKKLTVITLLLLTILVSCNKKKKDDSKETALALGAIQASNDAAANAGRPFAVTYTPRDGDTNVSLNVVGTVTFSEPMDVKTITTNIDDTKCSGSIQVSSDDFATCVKAATQPLASNENKTFTLTPATSLAANTKYKARITTDAKDLEGKPFLTSRTSVDGWTTGAVADTTAPKVSAVYPANGAVDVSANTSITVTFSEAMEPSSITANTTDTSCATGTFLVSSDDFATCVQAKGSITIGSNNVDYVFQPASNLTEGATYKVKIKSTVKDASNVAMGADYVQSTGFKIASSGTTTPTTDTTPPTVSSVYPTDGSTGIGIDANITATFSETLLSSSVTATSFVLKQGATIIPAAVSLNGTVATLNPDSNLTGNTTYTVILTTAIKDAAGNALASNYTWSFTSGTAISGAVETPTFSPNAGHYSTAQNITISTATTGASIYYTTDGTTPTASSTLYTTPIHIWSLAGKTVNAIAKKSGMTDSAVASGVFSYLPLKTGQTTSYAANDDGASQNGVARGYSDNGNGTVTDTATGLVWQKCS
ncbi:MAG: Ig-like domain-containing protein, partial [Leptospiraceae bacterium]|nr:Ig-like domain-containing protein [Leptospiraceae bacterium]